MILKVEQENLAEQFEGQSADGREICHCLEHVVLEGRAFLFELVYNAFRVGDDLGEGGLGLLDPESDATNGLALGFEETFSVGEGRLGCWLCELRRRHRGKGKGRYGH